MRHISEELIIDYVLNNLDLKKQKIVESHLDTCDSCKETFYFWQQSLTRDISEVPIQELTDRMTNTIEQKSVKRQKKFWKKPMTVMISSAAVFLLCLGLYQILTTSSQSPGDSLNHYITAQHDQIPEEEFLQDPETNHLNILPATTNTNVSSDVWLNQTTNELLLLVEGLTPLESHDYQLWFIHNNNDWDGELLHLQDGTVRVYYRGNDIDQLKILKVSVEPRGGSLTPTGPDTLYLDFERSKQ